MTVLTQRAKDRIAVVRQWRGNKDADAAIMEELLSEIERLTTVAARENPDACQQDDLVTEAGAGPVDSAPVIWAWPSGNSASTSIYPDDGDTDTVGLVKYIRADLTAPMTVEAAAKVLMDAHEGNLAMFGKGRTLEQVATIVGALRTLSGEKS